MKKNSSARRLQRMVNWKFTFPIAIVLIVYGAVMLLANHQSVWFDEGYTIMVARRSVSDVIQLTAVDAHPPLYYLLLKAWAGMFGWSEFALRSLSAALTGVMVAASFMLMRRLFGARTALIALPFVLIAPFVLRYGYEIRMYALAGLIGVLATYALVVAEKVNNKRAWILYAVLVAVGMYTLYMLMALWLAHLVWIVWHRKHRLMSASKIIRQHWVWAFVLSVVLFLPQLPTFIHQLLHSALPGIGKEVTLTRLVDIWSTLVSYRSEWEIGGWLSIPLLAAFVLLVYILAKVHRQLSDDGRHYLNLFVLLVLVPIGFFAIMSLPPKQPIFINRYMAHVAIYFYMLVGLAVALGWKYKHKISAGVLAITALSLLAGGAGRLAEVGNFNVERQQYPLTAQLATGINCGKDRPVIAEDPYTYIDSYFYLAGRCPLLFYSVDPVAMQGGYAPLYNSPYRLGNPKTLNYPTLTYIHWVGQGGLFNNDHRYRLISSSTYNKQVVEVYRLASQ